MGRVPELAASVTTSSLWARPPGPGFVARAATSRRPVGEGCRFRQAGREHGHRAWRDRLSSAACSGSPGTRAVGVGGADRPVGGLRKWT